MRTLLWLIVLPLVLLAALGLWLGLRPQAAPQWEEHRVTRGTVVRHALAVGRIEPLFEIPVTPTNGGVVTEVYVELGQRVEEGDPLLEVRPVLTDAQRLQAERALLAAREAELGAAEIVEGSNLMGRAMRLVQGGASLERMRAGAERARSSAEEQWRLLLEGSVEVEGFVIDWIVRARASGHVIALDAERGMPVVPASTFGSGTELCVLGDLDRPVFRGTVDELDAGRLREGMRAQLTLGALPGEALAGELREISLRGTRRDNAVVIPVELDVEAPPELVLRSGYSAVARIEVERAEQVVVVPERLVHFEGENAWVLVRGPEGEPVARDLELGLGDGLQIEVRQGLEEGALVLERVGG